MDLSWSTEAVYWNVCTAAVRAASSFAFQLALLMLAGNDMPTAVGVLWRGHRLLKHANVRLVTACNGCPGLVTAFGYKTRG